MGFALMVVSDKERISTDDLSRDISQQMAGAMAALLRDDTGEVRRQILDRLSRLWTVYEEHNPHEESWAL